MSTSNAAVSALNAVWAECAGIHQYIGCNSSGAGVRIGMGPGKLSPGELMKIALATCNTPSADHRLAKAPGEDPEAAVGCSTVKNGAEERYGPSQIEVVTDLPPLDVEQRELLSQRVVGTVDRYCTAGHTTEYSASYTTTIVDPSEG